MLNRHFQPCITEITSAAVDVRNKNVKAIYSKEECYSTVFKPEAKIPWTSIKIPLPPIPTGPDVWIFDNLSDEQLFWDFKNTAELYFARGELQDNFDRFIEKFRQNKGGVYEHEVMTNRVMERDETNEYSTLLEDYIAEQLKTKFTKLEEVDDPDPYFSPDSKTTDSKLFINNKGSRDSARKKFDKPTYSYTPLYLAPIKATDGLTIALNDIWSAEVLLKQVQFSGDDYIVKYQVSLYDHFGLDLPDMEKIFNVIPSIGEVFVCWFILQHLRGYKPFITKMTFIKEFKGNLQKGANERQNDRTAIEKAADLEIANRMREIMSGPKF